MLESRTIQSLPSSARSRVIESIAKLVAPKGTLLVITSLRNTEEEPGGPPWPLSELELSQFKQWGLQEIRRDLFYLEETSVKQLRIEYSNLLLH